MTHNSPHPTGAQLTAAKPFAWGMLAPDDRDWLKKRTQDIETFSYRIGCDVARIGMILSEVRARIGKGHFAGWLAKHTPFRKSNAYRLMDVGKWFGGHQSQIGTFEPTALYVLSSEKVPQQARDHALALADGKEKITRAKALEIVDAYKPVRVTAQDVAATDRLNKKLNTLVVQGERINQDAITQRMENQDAGMFERIGRSLSALLESSTMVSFQKLDEGEGDAGFAVTIYSETSHPRKVFVKELDYGLQTLSGREGRKQCQKCCADGETIPTSAFGFNKDHADRLNPICRDCEKARKRNFRERRRNGQVKKRGSGT